MRSRGAIVLRYAFGIPFGIQVCLGVEPKQAGGTILMKSDVKIGDNVGTIGRGAEDQGDVGDWKRTIADFTLTVDHERFSAAIRRGAFAFNDAIVATIMKEQQR